MKGFLKSILFFVFPIVMVMFGLEYLVRSVPNSYELKSKVLKDSSNNIETLILGSSHTFYGLNPKYFESSAFNMSNVSQSPAIDLAILNSYEDALKNLKFVVIRLSYDTLFEQLKNSSEDWRLKDYKLYTCVDFNYSLKHHSELFATSFKQSLNVLKNEYLEDKPLLNCDNFGFGTDLESKVKRDVARSGLLVAQRHTANSWDLLEKNIKVFQEIMKFCKERNIEVLLITPPAFKSYFENLNTKQLGKMVEVGANLDNQFDNCTYYNFLEHKDYTVADFYDADHLSENGAKKFSLLINSIIEQ